MKSDEPFKVGDPVAYSVQFLESIGASQMEVARYRGKVMELKTVGEREFASVEWESDNISLAATCNLAHVGPNMRYCKC